jgi:hypothetical protein
MCGDPISKITNSISGSLGTDGSGGGILGSTQNILNNPSASINSVLNDPTSVWSNPAGSPLGMLVDPIGVAQNKPSYANPDTQAVILAVAAYYGIPASEVTAADVGTAAEAGVVDSGSAAAASTAIGTGTAGTAGVAGADAAGLAAADSAAVGAEGMTPGLMSSYGSVAPAAATAAGTAGTASSSLIPGISNAGLLAGGLNTIGSIVNANSAKSAAAQQAAAQLQAAQIAADAAKFRPIGVTTGFGSSQFGYSPNGNLASASYTLTPEMQAQRNALIASSNGLLSQATGAQAATAPMGAAAQQAMQLGQGYLSTDPVAQAQKYYADQQAILAPSRANDMAALQAQMQAQGRGGFAIGGGVGGQGAANPQLQALLNAQMQQDTQLAANATQGGMNYAQFGAGMVGTGGDLLNSMYGTQSAAFNPYKTALGGAQTIEGLGQNALTTGMSMGNTTTAANANAGGLLASGITNAAATQAPSNAYSPWGALLSGAGNVASGMSTSGYKYDPMTGKAL